jgi:phosphatidylserine/phosphatidylglycerophosphate/cardiolipin synthase-like enzyme
VRLDDWFLTRSERGNASTRIDERHPGLDAWSTGNEVRALVHGATYFAELLRGIEAMRAGDVLLFTDWRGDPDELLAGPGTEISRTLEAAARRGVVVKGLVWRSHLDRFRFSASENRHLGEDIEAAGGECLLDMRVRPLGSHHQKLVVLRHPGRPELDVAFLGGIDLCHSRHDDDRHVGDPQPQPMADVYGERPPWHDIQIAIRGPAVADVELVFRERWEDPQPLSANPLRRLADRLRGLDLKPGELPDTGEAPPPAGTCALQVLRTYPRRRHAYSFAPQGERSVARGYVKALGRARSLIYLEDQYLWSQAVAKVFARSLRSHPELRIIAVVPRYPDQDGRISAPPNDVGRSVALRLLREAGGDRVALYGIENEAGTPIYVHAKACIVDDTWATIGSDNFNRRSWTFDSEVSAAVVDEALDARDPVDPGGRGDGARRYARQLRLTLAAEHLGRRPDDTDDLVDPSAAFHAFAAASAALEAWHRSGCQGARPPGQLRPVPEPDFGPWTRRWATALNRVLYDPDGRTRAERRRREF